MVPTLLALASFPALDLNTLSAADAIRFDGLPVYPSVEVVNPPDWHDGITYVGDDTQPDRIARTVLLKGWQDIGRNDRVTVVGRLKVIVHRPTVMDGEFFRGFAEVRVTGWYRLSP